MSWCRFGSPCTNGYPPNPVDETCVDCPGSALYVYEGTDGYYHCCWCLLRDDGEDHLTETAEEMWAHVDEHVNAGHHVRMSMRREHRAR